MQAYLRPESEIAIENPLSNFKTFLHSAGQFLFSVYVLLIVNFHAATGTTHGTIASAAKSISNVSFFLCCVFYQNNFH